MITGARGSEISARFRISKFAVSVTGNKKTSITGTHSSADPRWHSVPHAPTMVTKQRYYFNRQVFIDTTKTAVDRDDNSVSSTF